MSPSDIEEYIELRPMPSLRLTLSSGDQIVITDEDDPKLLGLSLVLRSRAGNRQLTPRLVSVPNIVLVEPVEYRRPGTARRRR
jgi:hypothetical protein